MTDDLSAPLGQEPKGRRRLAMPKRVWVGLAGVLGLSVATFLLWAATIDDPLGGEPMVVVSAGLQTPPPPRVLDGNPPVKIEAPSRYDGPVPGPAPAGKTVTIIDGTSGKREEVVIPASPGGRTANASANPSSSNPQLLETSRHGPIPKVGDDGARPSLAYAQPAKPPPGKPDGPRIAVIVGGLGIGASSTSEALGKLPAPVSLAFPPYGSDLPSLAARARGNGHEVLLQVPMEPFDYPDNDPGPQTLLTTLDANQNVDRLHWLMSRFQGYVGIANFMGGRFTASEPALSPVLREAAKRGLLYVDDGASPRSLAGQIAGANNLPFAKADVVIDAVPTAAEIDRALARLEAAARERGFAVGITSALPVAVERIAQWSKAVERRGFVLVPISAVASKAKAS